MTKSSLPRPTRSGLTNRRLNKAIKAQGGRFPQEPGLRLPARRSGLPTARRADVTMAVTGTLVILSLMAGLLAI